MLKNALFQIHWLLGLVGGAVLALVGVTGAMLSFEPELIAAFNPGIVTPAPRAGEPLSPPMLLARLVENNPERRVTTLEVGFGTDRTPRVGFALSPETATVGMPGRRVEWRYVDPHSAALLDAPRGEAFFRTLRELHRYLAAGPVGKQIVGASTAALIFLTITGIYLRWPRNPGSWRAWMHIDFGLRGRAFLYRLHAVVGTWVLLVYLVAALTGLTWSYEWYKSAFYTTLGAPAPARPPPAATGAPGQNAAATIDVVAMLQAVWPAVMANAEAIRTATIMFPDAGDKPVEIRYLTDDAPHERAFNRLVIDPVSGTVTNHERYADKSLGSRIAGSIFPLHRGSYFGVVGIVVMMLASLLMPLLAVVGLLMYLERRRRRPSVIEPLPDV